MIYGFMVDVIGCKKLLMIGFGIFMLVIIVVVFVFSIGWLIVVCVV